MQSDLGLNYVVKPEIKVLAEAIEEQIVRQVLKLAG